MGKGYNNYMTKKFFHPGSKENIKRVWMAEQKAEFDKKKQEDMLAQYQREQEMYGNRALLGDEKAKVGLSFMYDAPPGAKQEREKEDDEPEFKFEWQRKFNAPRESYAKDDETIRDQPFGIEVRNVRCIKCHKWGHVNTDKICPLFGRDITAEPPQPGGQPKSLIDGMKEEGFAFKDVVKGRRVNPHATNQQIVESGSDEDPEVQFLKSLTTKQKKKLLKKLDRLQKNQAAGGSEKKKKKRKHKKSSADSESDEPKSKKKKKSEKKKKERKRKASSSDSDSESESDSEVDRRNNKSQPRHRRDNSADKANSARQRDSSPYEGGRKRYEKDGEHSGHVNGRKPSEDHMRNSRKLHIDPKDDDRKHSQNRERFARREDSTKERRRGRSRSVEDSRENQMRHMARTDRREDSLSHRDRRREDSRTNVKSNLDSYSYSSDDQSPQKLAKTKLSSRQDSKHRGIDSEGRQRQHRVETLPESKIRGETTSRPMRHPSSSSDSGVERSRRSSNSERQNSSRSSNRREQNRRSSERDHRQNLESSDRSEVRRHIAHREQQRRRRHDSSSSEDSERGQRSKTSRGRDERRHNNK